MISTIKLSMYVYVNHELSIQPAIKYKLNKIRWTHHFQVLNCFFAGHCSTCTTAAVPHFKVVTVARASAQKKACRIFGKNIDTIWSRKDSWLVVEPTHLKNLLVKLDQSFSPGVKINNIWNYHLEYPWIVVSEQRFYYLSHEWKPWSAVNLVYLLHESFVK